LQYESDDVIASATPILFKSTQMYTQCEFYRWMCSNSSQISFISIQFCSS